MGGLPKKASTLESLRRDGAAPLVLDSGGLLFRPGPLPADQLAQLQATARGIVDAYNSMGFQAVAVAGPDLGAGLAFLLEMRKRSRFPWLSANIVSRSGSRHLFAPAATLAAGGLRIAVLGLTGTTDSAPLFSKTDDAVLLSWEKALPPQLAAVREKSDMLVLLSSLPAAENRRIAERFPEVHVIFQSGAGGAGMAPQLVNNTLITWVEQQGRYAGLLEAQWNPRQKRWKNPEDEHLLQQRKSELDGVAWQLGRLAAQGDPEVVYRDQPLRLRTYHALLARQKALKAEIGRLETEIARERTKNGEATFSHRFFAMDKKVPDQPEVRSIVDATTRKVNELGSKSVKNAATASKSAPPRPLVQGYAGSFSCRHCHEEQWGRWRATRHARAYDTLAAKNQQHNLRCLPCHVTGGFERSGEELLNHAEELRQVGCESCHGPGGDHGREPDRHKPLRLSGDLCLRCHTPEQSPDFRVDEAVGRLRCGG